MHKVLLFCSLFVLPACSNRADHHDAMWNFADNAADYYADRELTTARLQCAQGGYNGSGFDACVNNSVRY